MGNEWSTEESTRPAAGTADQIGIISENAKTERDEEAELEESDLDLGSETDLSHLFDVDNVHLIASNLRPVKETVYERCYQDLQEGLYNMENRTDIQTISFSRFCDMLKSLELSQADLMQVFNLLDYEGRGSFETVPVLQALRNNKKIMLNDDLNSVLKKFENCSWMPGFLDVYIAQKDSFKQHGLKILEYLIRNRFSGFSVNCQAIELFESACKLREKIVKSRIKSLEFPSHENGADLQSTAPLGAQTKLVLKMEDSVSGDHLLPEEVKKQELQQNKVHAGETVILWYTQLVTTTARACLPLDTELLSTALTHTRTMVSHLLPLSLCHDSEERPSFLNVDCFRELGSLIQLFPEKAELLDLSLSFHLACGSVSEIVHCLAELNVSTVQIECNNLLSNIDQVRRRLLEKHTRHLKVNLLGCDAEGAANQDPRSVLETNWKQSAFSTKPGETKVNFVFECSDWAEFTKITIKVASENSAPSHGFIFVLTEWHVDADSNLKKELEKFSLYDNWTESDYKSPSLKRLIEGSCVTNETVAYFSTMDRDEVDVVLDNPVTGKFIVVKFVEPRETGVDHLGIVGIKFYGVQITTGLGLLEQQISRSLLTAKPMESNQMAIQAVLRFLLLVFSCQVKKEQAAAEDIYHFSRESYVNVDRKTGIVAYDPPAVRFNSASTVMAKLPFSKECPNFEIEIVNRGPTAFISIGAAPRDLQIGVHPSYGYFADSGCLYVDGQELEENRRPRRCTVGDRMGCGVEFEGNKIKTVYFTKNGERVHDFAPGMTIPSGGLFPTVGMHYFGEKVRLINKEPWRFGDKPVEKVRTLVAQGSDFINPKHLDLSNVSIETLWKTYKHIPEKMDQGLILQLINSTLPHMKPESNNFKSSSEIFDHLCYLLDHANEGEEDDIISRSANDIIRDGLDLFFPCKEGRPKMFLDLLQESSESSLSSSKLILFQSLCHYFSTVDLEMLMPLPAKPSHLPEDFKSSNLFTIMEKLLSISFRDSLGLFQHTLETAGSTVIGRSVSLGDETLSGRKKSEYLFHLSKLFNQLQVRLFAWVSQELSKPQEATDDMDRLEKLIIYYCCQLITPKAEHFLTRMKMLKESDLRMLLPELDTSFLATTLRELILLLSELATKLSSRHKAKLLENLKPVMMTIRKLLFKLPDLLPSLDENQGEKQMEKELRTWEVDSPLTDRPNNVSLTFSCVRATHFEVEFDERCETEETGERLDFSDLKGIRRVFSGKVGRSNWPIKVRFEGTSAINFTYTKETSNTAGYKFKVKAIQTKVSDFHWLYDIYLSFCHLFGRISASVLDKTHVLPNSATSQDNLEMQMYRSELWTTVFRGGLIAKKFERSLSGNYETSDQSDVATFLNAVAEFKSEKAKAFINRCKSHHNRNHDIGGEEIDQVIASVFSALLWHTQSLRHDVNIYLRNEFDGKISDGIHEAYSAAENLRLFLAERRQTMRKELEEQREREGTTEGEKGKEAAVDVVHLVEEKSKFLLQFAGLSRVSLKAEELKKKSETRRSRQQSISHRLSHETSVDLSISVETKYPSFRLVFDFVQDIVWTKDKVEDLLKKRYINSESLWKTYSFMSEFFRTISSELLENDMSGTVFIRELLASQDKFGRHYADGIDGCGLGMEANVRSSYYGLLRHLVTLLRKDISKPVGSEVLATCVLHLLDIDWQGYDLRFVVELRLPEFYFTLAKVHQEKILTIKDPMSAYFHHHSWMLFSTTALSALDFLMSKASEEKVQRVDENYFYSARQLYSICLETAVDYLVRELSTDESFSSSEAEATQMETSMEASEHNEESLVSKIIGLIAALIPPNNQNPTVTEVTEVLSSEKFLMALFDIARGKKVHDVVTRHMALGLLGKLLQQMSISSEASKSLKSSESGEIMIVDPKAVDLVQSLFDFGADCLKRHGLELAKSTSQVLHRLQMNPTWTQLLAHRFSISVDLMHSSPTMSSIFALFAFTGFPEMLTVGTLVTHVEKDKEVIRSVVRCKKSDEAMCTIFELASRKKRKMKDTLLDVVANNKSFLTENQISQFIKLIIETVNQKVIPGLAVDAQSLWQLALVIKASLQSVHNNQSKVNLELYENSFLQCLSRLASLGTGLSKSLLLRDLEVLSLELNKRSQSQPGLIAESEEVTTTDGDDMAADNNDNHNDNGGGDDDDDDDANDDGVLASSSSSEDGDRLLTPQTAEQMRSTNTEPAATEEIADTIPRETGDGKKRQDQATQRNGEIGLGLGIGQYISDLLHAEIEIDKCIEESNPQKPCLISKSEDKDKETTRKRKEKSSNLVEKMLSSKEKGLLIKVNRALGILYARKLLMALVSECPDVEAMKFYIIIIFYILPLPVGPEANGTLEKIIKKVVNCCQPDDIVSMAVISCFFVATTDGQMVTVSKQIPSTLLSRFGDIAGSSSPNFMDEVYLPGATALKVELDKSSCGRRDVELVFSSSPDLTKNRQCFSGRSSENWKDFTIKGDHLYCTLSGPDLTLVSSSFQFKVKGIVSFSDHFDVGYLTLCAIFDKPESTRLLTVGRLWKLLIGMANRSVKTKRLKAIQLLLKLMSLQTKSRGCEELSVDLSLLKGLWQMYQKMMEATKDSTEVQPALVLALTELFYVAQNLAKEWNAIQSFMTSMEADGSVPQSETLGKLIQVHSTVTEQIRRTIFYGGMGLFIFIAVFAYNWSCAY